MDIANLSAFIKVAESGSFSIAAQQLFLTQPAISKRIRQLEDYYGSRLIDRRGKQIHLTQTGKALLPRARQILHEMQSIRQQITDMEGNPMGSLSMATSHHIGLHRLPPILRKFSADYPEVDLDLDFMDSEQACQLIELNELDLAVVTLPFERSSRLDYYDIWTDQLLITCAHDHPLSQLANPGIQDLVNYPAVLPSHGTFTREAIETALAPVRDQLNISLETNYLETIKMLVSVGLGWSILPKTMLQELFTLELAGFQAERQLGIVINRNRTRSKAVHMMIELLQQQRN